MAPFSGVDELEEQVSATGDDRQISNLVDDQQIEAAEVADALAQRAVAFGLGESRDDVCQRTEVDAAPGFDRFDTEGRGSDASCRFPAVL